MAKAFIPYDGPIVTCAEARAAGLKRYFTGACKHGHISERDVASYRCVRCQATCCMHYAKRHSEDRKAKRIVKKTDPMRISRKTAKAGGLEFFFTGKPCAQGHTAERFVTGQECRVCRDERRARNLTIRGTPWKGQPSQKKTSDEERKTHRRMSSGIYKAIHGNKGGRRWETLTGYTLAQLTAHLERQFTKGMSWDNMGKWHIDHIIPLASFKFETPDELEFKAAWALTNLRPLWAKENMKKRDLRTVLL